MQKINTKEFFEVPLKIWEDKSLSKDSLILYFILCRYVGGKYTVKEITEIFGNYCDIWNFDRAFDELINSGFVNENTEDHEVTILDLP